MDDGGSANMKGKQQWSDVCFVGKGDEKTL